MKKTHILIIGGGFTGCAAAHDLALRGFAVTLVERGELTSGTSGRTHGLLHSGARYCTNDQESARECIQENQILRRIVPNVIEPNGGLFVGIDESDMAFASMFEEGAAACGIEARPLSPAEVLKMEPAVTPQVKCAFLVPDGTFDPLRLAFSFAATALSNGARILPYHQVEELIKDTTSRITGAKVLNRVSGERMEIQADMVLSCTGSWSGQVAAMAGVRVPISPTPGVMVAFDKRFTDRVINRLNVPDDGDILLPQRRMIVVGTTSFEIQDLDYIPVTDDQVEMMAVRGEQLIPALRQAKMRGEFMSSRPLIGKGMEARSLARTFKCIDHENEANVYGFITVTGGKATTCRAMAEKAADLVCEKLGVSIACQTQSTPLISYRQYYRLSPN